MRTNEASIEIVAPRMNGQCEREGPSLEALGLQE